MTGVSLLKKIGQFFSTFLALLFLLNARSYTLAVTHKIHEINKTKLNHAVIKIIGFRKAQLHDYGHVLVKILHLKLN